MTVKRNSHETYSRLLRSSFIPQVCFIAAFPTPCIEYGAERGVYVPLPFYLHIKSYTRSTTNKFVISEGGVVVYSKKQKYELTFKEAPCPICRNNKAHLLYSIDSEQAAAHILGKSAGQERRLRLASLVQRLWQGNKCDFVRCDVCQYCFAVPFVQGDNEFYALAYDTETNYPSWKWEYRETYDALQDMLHRKKAESFALLEIGAGNGSFVKRVSPALFRKENVVCIEFSEVGRRSVEAYGILCLSEDVRTLELAKFQSRFDIVCMFQVLEHLDDLDVLFECLNRITRESATFFISIPNDKRREFFDLNGIIEDIPPTHLGRFNRSNLEMLANRHGWQIIQYKREPESFVSKVISFSFYALARIAFWNNLDQIKNRFFRRCVKTITAVVCMTGFFPAIVHLRSNELGVSQWARLEKVERRADNDG